MLGRIKRGPFAAETMFAAVVQLVDEGSSEFDECQLILAAWQKDKARFGLHGHRDKHPDSKRTYVEILKLVKQGYLDRPRQNIYRLTMKGLDLMAEQTKRKRA